MTHPGNPELVTVIVPVFNAERFLRATLESVLNQTYPLVEVIAVDDDSTDGSVELIREYSSRVTLIRQANKGSGAARNTGVRAARGNWIAFIDSDYTWTPDKL